MKKIIILFLFVTSVLQAQTTYYVAATGGDNGNPGTSGEPWATLAYAVTQASATDTIYMQAGTHTINTTVDVPVGINIRGAGATSIITSASLTAEWGAIIRLSSASHSNGNQSISYLKFDGDDLTAAQALWIEKRNGVKIHHCTFINFNYLAAYWIGNGGDIGNDPYTTITYPTNYCTGSELHDNTITNCSIYSGYGRGAFYLRAHDGMLIYNNTITQNQRASGSNGYPLKIIFLRGAKIYDNTITLGGFQWGFAIESFLMEGVEIYGNDIIGAVDVNITRKNSSGVSYDYGLWVHNNTIGPGDVLAQNYTGVYLEFYNSDVIIEKNQFTYCYDGITFTPRSTNQVERVRISYNVFHNQQGGYYILGSTDAGTYYFDRIQMYNNVFDGSALWGLSLFGAWNDFEFKNNIITGTSYYWCGFRGSAADSIYIMNNIIYDNAQSNNVLFEEAATNYTNSGNIDDNPDFTGASDFTLQAGSPAIDAGLGVGLITDILGNTVGDSPDIGAYEYDSDPPDPPGLPEITTGTIASIKSVMANVPSVIISDGGGTITQRGICYSTSVNPTISDRRTTYTGTEGGSYTDVLRGLQPNTTYHVRAYVVNESGTSYGADVEFTTAVSTVPTHEGKYLYHEGKIVLIK